MYAKLACPDSSWGVVSNYIDWFWGSLKVRIHRLQGGVFLASKAEFF